MIFFFVMICCVQFNKLFHSSRECNNMHATPLWHAGMLLHSILSIRFDLLAATLYAAESLHDCRSPINRATHTHSFAVLQSYASVAKHFSIKFQFGKQNIVRSIFCYRKSDHKRLINICRHFTVATVRLFTGKLWLRDAPIVLGKNSFCACTLCGLVSTMWWHSSASEHHIQLRSRCTKESVAMHH